MQACGVSQGLRWRRILRISQHPHFHPAPAVAQGCFQRFSHAFTLHTAPAKAVGQHIQHRACAGLAFA